MSLYNALFGTNKISPLLLKVLDIDQPSGKYRSGRFRDIYLNEDGSKIILLTRNGGGNREEYQPLIDVLATHPNYITDYDDDFDPTYAYIEFSVPKDFKEDFKKLAMGEKPKNISEKFNKLISDIGKGKTTEETKKAEAVGKKIFGAIDKGETIIEVKSEDRKVDIKN